MHHNKLCKVNKKMKRKETKMIKFKVGVWRLFYEPLGKVSEYSKHMLSKREIITE